MGPLLTSWVLHEEDRGRGCGSFQAHRARPSVSSRLQARLSLISRFKIKSNDESLLPVQAMTIPNSYSEWGLNVATLLLRGAGCCCCC